MTAIPQSCILIGMAHFYGAITGQAGTATRMGSKRSGYSAWAQNGTGQVHITLSTDKDRDIADISIRASTRSYSSQIAVGFYGLDLSALVTHADNPKVRRYLDKAADALQQANAIALTREK